MRDQLAEYVAAFANAKGGVLVLGIEDDHTPTGAARHDDSATRCSRLQKYRLTSTGRQLATKTKKDK